jgi:hypothetical protein
MNAILEKIISEKLMTLELYQKGYEVWKSCTESEKYDFYQAKVDSLLAFGGVFLDQGTLLKTSGSSTGLVKKYYWGPNFDQAFMFHDHLCFGDVDTNLILEIYFTFTKEVFSIDKGKERNKYQSFVVYCNPSNINYQKIEQFAKSKLEKKQVLIRILPTQCNISILRNDSFFENFNPKKYVFQSTGETCSQEVKYYFKNLGLQLRDTMKVWNAGASFYTCKFGSLHWDDFTCQYHHSNNSKKLVCTDLFNLSQVFHLMPTGDKVQINKIGTCECGLEIQENKWEDKFSIIQLNGLTYNWNELRNEFLRALTTVTNKNNDEWWDELLGLSVGVSPNSINIFYQTKSQIDNQTLNLVKNFLMKKWGKFVNIESGLHHNKFKTKRVFLMEKDIAIPIKI